MQLPATVISLLAAAPVVGFSGSRAPAPASLAAAQLVAAAVPVGVPVVVGCAAGIDQRAQQLMPSARVFHASSFGIGRSAVARRSIACVQACAISGVWCSFPAQACPSGVRPSSSSAQCFNGSGSGSWASLALAVGLGLSVVVFLPVGVSSPGWGLLGVGGGWFVATAPAQQLAFF